MAPNKTYEIPAGGFPVAVEESASPKVDELVRGLVSSRPAPYRSGSGAPLSVMLADRYSTPEVELALKALKAMGPAAFPALVKHLGDDRYSFSRVVQGWVNFSVSDAVIEVLDDGHYDHGGYLSREVPTGPGAGYLSFEAYLKARGAEAWAEWARSRSRLEIQMAFIDWCIEKEKERGFVDDPQTKRILGNYETARQRVKKQYSDAGGAVNRLEPTGSQTNRESVIEQQWFSPVDGRSTKGEFIDLNSNATEKLYIKYCPIADSGVELERWSNNVVVWRAHLQPLGVEHSMYVHRVNVSVEKKGVFVLSRGARNISEVHSLKTGALISREVYDERR